MFAFDDLACASCTQRSWNLKVIVMWAEHPRGFLSSQFLIKKEQLAYHLKRRSSLPQLQPCQRLFCMMTRARTIKSPKAMYEKTSVIGFCLRKWRLKTYSKKSVSINCSALYHKTLSSQTINLIKRTLAVTLEYYKRATKKAKEKMLNEKRGRRKENFISI